MNDLMLPAAFGAPSPLFKNQGLNNDLGAGISAGFGVISCRGKVWRTKFRGEETVMTIDQNGHQVPQHSIEVVIVKASPHLSKIFYSGGYEEGSNESPDCFSPDAIMPDPSSPKLQSPAGCAVCPKNQWGSRITDNNKKGKACADSKRLAIVPLQDMGNEVMGGPMLLRVPAASLGDMKTFSEKLDRQGYPYSSIGTRIAFDMQTAFPKFIFSPIRPLSDDEAAYVLELQDDPRVLRILSDPEPGIAKVENEEEPEIAFEQPKPEAKQARTAAPVEAPVAAPVARRAPAPAPTPAAAPAPVQAASVAVPPPPVQNRPARPAVVATSPKPKSRVVEAAPEQTDIEQHINAVAQDQAEDHGGGHSNDHNDDAASSIDDDLDAELAKLMAG